ncbi:hypothetical protein KSC_001850 [Ktedonobacter sp. SOSP1-52]|nr:hypothetical protein KSC_001850 [Ktedonobacter sp. SOSP1-52]
MFEQAIFGQKFLGVGAFFEQFIDQFASNGHVIFSFFIYFIHYVSCDHIHKIFYTLAYACAQETP